AYGNKEEEQAETLPARSHISLVFYEDMDVNPLTATNRENHELLKLVYSPLLRLNEQLKPVYVLAESVKVSGKTVTVTLKKGLKFSDGSKVTAADAIASIKTVRNTPASPYNARLADLKNYWADNERTFTIKLREENVDIAACLDIPVVKRGKNSVGCGPYRFSRQGGKQVLVPNKHYFEQPTVQTIYLKAPATDQSAKQMFSVGLLDVYFAGAESDQVFSGGKNYTVQSYPGDNLLYLGVNCEDPLLKNRNLRGFLSKLIDRRRITENVLLDQADPAAYPYQPGWYKVKESTEAALSDAEKKAQAEALGLTLSEKALLDKKGKQISLSLLVSQGGTMHSDTAKAVADSFALSGVRITVEAVSNEEYLERLAAGEYQLYLGEIRTGRTLNTNLFAADSAVNFSGATFKKLSEGAAQYKAGEITLEAFSALYDAYTPVIPLAYRRGVLYASSDIGGFREMSPWALYGDGTKLVTKETELKQ
ncbi:MAG: ABC transporter substrate-binding protein, partial [Clostridia bacterium]|nr:ABC transporter substrate-binding protein [Clostridia bacterium]